MSERPPEAPPGDQAPPPPTPPSSTTEPPPPAGSPSTTEPLPPAGSPSATEAVPPPETGPGAAQAPPPPGPPPGPTQTLPPPGPGPGPGPGGVRRLTRRTDNRIIAGVASGIADYLGIQPWLVRIAFVVLVPFGGLGALAYLIAWLLVPVAGSSESLASGVLHRPPSGLRSYLGVALILLAVVILASAFSDPQVIWAVALIAFGIFLFRQDDPRPPDRRPPSGGGPGPDPATTTATLPPGPPAAAAVTTTDPLGPPAAGQDTATLPDDLPAWSPPPPSDPAAAWGAPPPRRPRRRPFLGPLTFAVALIVTGLTLVLDNLNVLDLTVGQHLAVFLTVLGGGLLVGTWWGRAWGLIPVGLLAVPLVAVTALAGSVPVQGGVADRMFQPTAVAQVRDAYRLAGGELVLDLSKVDFEPGAPPIEASVAGGRMLVVVPDEVAAEVRGRVGIGVLDLFGHQDVGAQVDSTVTEPALQKPAKGAAPTVRLDLMAGYGVIEVRRASDPRRFDEVGPFEDSFTDEAATTTTGEIP
jgi:phage shock protein PspC (stress-responsive transcriptional regulator)